MSGKLVVICGTNDSAVKSRALDLAREWCGADLERASDLEIIRGDDESVNLTDTLGTFLAAVDTPPFFGGSKTVWLRHCRFWKDFADAKPGKELQRNQNRFLQFLKEPKPDNMNILIDGGEVDQRKAFYKALKAADAIELEILNLVNPRNSKDFAREQAAGVISLLRKAGKRIDPAAAEYLSLVAGSDFARRATELEKVICYVGERETISLEDCRSVCTASVEAVSWELSEALTNRDTARALGLITPLLRQRRQEKGASSAVELGLLYSAVNAYTDLLQTLQAMAELNVPPRVGPNYFSAIDPALKEQYPKNLLLRSHPYRAYKLCESARRFRMEEVADALDTIAESFRQMVSGGDQLLVLEQMISALCSGRKIQTATL